MHRPECVIFKVTQYNLRENMDLLAWSHARDTQLFLVFDRVLSLRSAVKLVTLDRDRSLEAAVTINRLRSANRLSSTELKSEFRLKLILCNTLARFLWYYGGVWYINILC